MSASGGQPADLAMCIQHIPNVCWTLIAVNPFQSNIFYKINCKMYKLCWLLICCTHADHRLLLHRHTIKFCIRNSKISFITIKRKRVLRIQCGRRQHAATRWHSVLALRHAWRALIVWMGRVKARSNWINERKAINKTTGHWFDFGW